MLVTGSHFIFTSCGLNILRLKSFSNFNFLQESVFLRYDILSPISTNVLNCFFVENTESQEIYILPYHICRTATSDDICNILNRDLITESDKRIHLLLIKDTYL